MKINFKKILLILSIFLPLIVTLISLNYLPNLIPAHYGFDGEVTRWGSKYESLIVPIMGIVVCGVILICTSYAEKKIEYKNNIKALNATNVALSIMFNILTYSFLITSFNKVTNFNNSFASKILYIAFGISFIILGIYMPKVKRNSFIGIRTKLTLSSDYIWKKTHEFGGKVFIIFGFIFTVLALFIPGDISMIILIISLILLTILFVIYSRKIAKENKDI